MGKQAGCWRRANLDDLLDGLTSIEFILRFTFTNPDLDTAIVGTVHTARLQINLDILQLGPLPPDLYEEAKHRLAAAGSRRKRVGNDRRSRLYRRSLSSSRASPAASCNTRRACFTYAC